MFELRGCTRKLRRVRLIRFLARGVRLRTFREMQRVLADMNRVVTRICKRMPRSFATHMLIAIAPPAQTCVSCAAAPTPGG